MHRFFAVILLAGFTGITCAQDIQTADGKNPGPFVFISPHYGFIVPHTKQMEHLIQGHSYGLFGQLLFPTIGRDQWSRVYNLPEHGIDLFFNYTGNTEQLGYQFSTCYFINLPLNRKKNSDRHRIFRHWLGLGLGAGYATKIWDLEDNHQSAVLGSRLNTALVLEHSFCVWTNRLLEIRSGIRITHYSNGAFQAPNLGTNNASIFIGIIPGYRDHRDYTLPETPDKSSPRSIAQSLSLSLGIKEIPPPTGPKYMVYILSYLADYRLSLKGSIGPGLDAIYNSSLVTLLERRDQVSYTYPKALQLGFILGGTWHFGKFELKIQQGFYLLDRWKENGLLYHRFGLRYQCSDHFLINFMLKTHFAKADHGEWGIGYVF